MVVAPMLGIAPCPQARPATDNGLLMLLTGPIFCTKQIGERLMEITSYSHHRSASFLRGVGA